MFDKNISILSLLDKGQNYLKCTLMVSQSMILSVSGELSIKNENEGYRKFKLINIILSFLIEIIHVIMLYYTGEIKQFYWILCRLVIDLWI